jgi:hypothetical protein
VENRLLIDGRYRLRERLGHGGMSVVWRAGDEVLGRDVAVKVMNSRLAEDPAVLRRLRDEARAAAGLKHAHVVEVYDYGESAIDGTPTPYVVMELVDGQSVADLLKAGVPPWQPAVLIGAQTAAALAAAHARGVVHRDVKPANVMVTAAGVKLVDFGISAAVGEVDADDLGTPAYLAPERVNGGPVRPATDVYALGLLLYLMLCGRLPWPASTVTQMIRAHVHAAPAALPPVTGLPAAVPRLIDRCLAKRPGDRPTAAEVADRLGEIAGLPARGVFPLSRADTMELARPVPSRRPAVAALGAALLLAGGLVAWQWNAGKGSGSSPAAAATVAPSVPAACTVRYALRGTDSGRAATAVTIRNTGPAPLPQWRLSFALPSGQRLLRGRGVDWSQQGGTVHATGGQLPAGGSVAAGFDVAYGEVAALPVSFRLNGTTCVAEMSVQAPSAHPTQTPAKPATPAAPAGRPAAPEGKPAAPGPGKEDSGKHKDKGKDKGKEKAKKK